MEKVRFRVIFIPFLIVLTLLNGFFFISERLHYYNKRAQDYIQFLYNEMIFNHVANNLINSENPRESLNNLAEYFSENITEDSYSHNPQEEINAVLIGNGLCSVQSLIANILLEKLNVESKIVHSKWHTFIEFKLDERWILFEPFGGIIYRNASGDFLSIEDWLSKIKNETNYIVKFLGEYSLKESFNNNETLKEYIIELYSPLDFINNYIPYDDLDINKSHVYLLDSWLNFFTEVCGETFYYFIQDLYLFYMNFYIDNFYSASYIETENLKDNGWITINVLHLFSNQTKLNPAEKNEAFLLLKARHYELLDRNEKAEEIYKSISQNYFNEKHALYALYYYGRLLYKTKRYSQAIQIFKTALQKDSEKKFKLKIILYFIGRCYEEMRDINMALNYYHAAASTPLKYYSEFQFKRASMRASQIEKQLKTRNSSQKE